jgi:hypothetical protein
MPTTIRLCVLFFNGGCHFGDDELAVISPFIVTPVHWSSNMHFVRVNFSLLCGGSWRHH